jgi:hypothetical protein
MSHFDEFKIRQIAREEAENVFKEMKKQEDEKTDQHLLDVHWYTFNLQRAARYDTMVWRDVTYIRDWNPDPEREKNELIWIPQ